MKYYKIKALTNFFWTGNDWIKVFIRRGEIIEGDKEFKKQIVYENKLGEFIENDKVWKWFRGYIEEGFWWSN